MTISGSTVPADAVPVAPLLEIVVPVHNEAAVLARSIGLEVVDPHRSQRHPDRLDDRRRQPVAQLRRVHTPE